MCDVERRYEADKEQAEAEIKRLRETVARLAREKEAKRPFFCNVQGCKKRCSKICVDYG